MTILDDIHNSVSDNFKRIHLIQRKDINNMERALVEKREDFLIVLQTPIHAEMFKKFAEGKVVCVAATHGTNAYHFKLVTLLVVDEYGEGFPVA